MNFTIPHDQMNRLLDYVVHRADCDTVVYRFDGTTCTCGLLRILGTLAEQEYLSDLPRVERVLTNRNMFGGRSTPEWLCRLVSPKFRPISHRDRYQPSHMSDG